MNAIDNSKYNIRPHNIVKSPVTSDIGDPIESANKIINNFMYYEEYIKNHPEIMYIYTTSNITNAMYKYSNVTKKLKTLFSSINTSEEKGKFLVHLFNISTILPVYEDFKEEIVYYQDYICLIILNDDTVAIIKNKLPQYCHELKKQ